MTSAVDQLGTLSSTVSNASLPDGLKERILTRLKQLSEVVDSPTFLPEFDRMNKYIDWVLNLPWNKATKDILDLEHARKVLDESHYGLDEIKDRILEYVSVMNLKEQKGESGDIIRAPILCFVGLVGTGKTTIASSIAKALGRNFARVPFGGMGDPLDLRGQSRMHAEAEPGKIVKALRYTGSKNSVLLLDEIDRVTDEGRSSIMGVLVELLDPEQNRAFIDHFVDYPFDLSSVLFIATANNTHSLATAVMDRLEPIQMPAYSDQEKITIATQYMLPKVLRLSGVSPESIDISDEVWAKIVRPLGFDAGMRTLERTIQAMVRKLARKIVEGKGDRFSITAENLKEFLPG